MSGVAFSVVLVQSVIWFIALAAPGLGFKSWPPMKNYDIWENSKQSSEQTGRLQAEKYLSSNFLNNTSYRESKVLNFFPVPVDDECLADDGRRSGICLNVYECRLKHGAARGECALGFGVCCVFVASCDQEIVNNITYIISPNFPSSMPNNMTSCRIKVKMMNLDISQLRIDFNHFSLGQPNRKNGICDGDVFQLSGGLGGLFTLCGQNSGQHVYYDVGGRITARQAALIAVNGISVNKNSTVSGNTSSNSIHNNEDMMSSDTEMNDIEIFMNFTNRILPTRIWEIRVTQIPFSQRAPAGCLQYFTGQKGIIQTFNFADNGRHLANQDYKSCIRQEHEMCSIAYQPCDEHSFKIGPNILSDDVGIELGEATDGLVSSDSSQINNITPFAAIPTSSTASSELSQQAAAGTSQSDTTASPTTNSVSTQQTETSSVSDQSDAIDEGSGGGDIPPVVSTAPVVGGGGGGGDDGAGSFDIFSFLRSTFFDFRRRRSGRQIFPACTDRITMPCIVEDFIGTGFGTIPDCEPVHCGDKFCSSSSNLCRIESTVTPFYLGIHFGDGNGKGSPEENIGACLRYNQMPCM